MSACVLPKSEHEMQRADIAGNNELLLCTLLGLIITRRGFKDAVLESLYEESQYPFELNGCSGYIRIDTSSIRSKSAFKEDVNLGLLGNIATRLPRRAGGDLCTHITAETALWRFTFTITQYERDQANEWVMVKDPLPLPDRETLGRYIVMSVTMNV